MSLESTARTMREVDRGSRNNLPNETILRMGEILRELLTMDSRAQESRLVELECTDPAMANRIRRRLALKEVPLSLDTPALNLQDSRPPRPLDSGDVLGSYRLLRPLGAGGMGVVYLAERICDFEQRVAVKIIRNDEGTSDFAARFEQERQLLARVEHPNIARILDGGSTPEGQPYFVMEYIEGRSIDQYCEVNGLSLRQRLALVLQLCAAVVQSHRKLVIHRDIKPSNVLVTNSGVVKLLDFGIAKLLHRGLTASSITRYRPMFTVPSASPEHLAGEAVDVTSDVYSLGVLIYRLLCRRLPHKLDGLTFAEILKELRDHRIQPPSLYTSKNSSSEALQDKERSPIFCPLKIPSDLDAIVLKALRYECWARYQSVEELASDLRDFLAGRPVSAMGDSWRYRLAKLFRRYRWQWATASMLILLGLVSGSTTTVLWREAVSARDAAEQSRDLAEIALQSATRSQQRAHRESERSNALLEVMLGRLELRQWFGQAKPAVVLSEFGNLLYERGSYAHAERLFLQAQSHRDSLPLPDRFILDSNLAAMAAHRGDYGRANALYEAVLTERRAILGSDHIEVAYTLMGLGSVAFTSGQLDAAEQLYGDAHEIFEAQDSVAPVLRGTLELNRAQISITQQRWAEARNRLGKAKAYHGATLPWVLSASMEECSAELFMAEGRYREAEIATRKALAGFQNSLITLDWRIAYAETLLGAALAAQGRIYEAKPYLVEGERIVRQERGDHSIYTARAQQRLSMLQDGALSVPLEMKRHDALDYSVETPRSPS